MPTQQQERQATVEEIERMRVLLGSRDVSNLGLQVSGRRRVILLDALLAHAEQLMPGTPAAQWRKVKDQSVLIFVVHPNAQYAQDAADLARWQGWCVGYWTDFNGGGWVWHGHLGDITHVMPLPGNPLDARRV